MMRELVAIVGAYGVGAWIAALVVAVRWSANQRTPLSGYLTLSGWGGVAAVCSAILAATVR
jgi:hypothetical protein